VVEKSLNGLARRNAAPLAYRLLGAGLFSRDTQADKVMRASAVEEKPMHEHRPFPRRPVHSNPARDILRKTPLSAAVSAVLATSAIPFAAVAQAPQQVQIEVMLVTATRRSESVQDIPINIAAFDGNLLEEREIGDLAELGRNVPGLYVVDQGKRTANHIVVRGLNLDSITSSEAIGNSGGNVVSTYVGDIPLYVDLALNDMERVEVLLGPQGTLYGAGTLGGAIRYLPRRPELETTAFEFRAGSFDLAEGDGYGRRGGATANFGIGDNFAIRASVDFYDDPGFIDNPFIVRESGLSDPEPDFTVPAAVAANLYRVDDANSEETFSGRVGLRWQPTAAIDANLTYYYQDMDVGGRSQNHVAAFGTGLYESAARYLEPNERTNRLAALEINADLGFATLTSATGYSTYEDYGQRDQTDLLITFEYTYQLFPTFSAFTRDTEHDRSLSQELRLVSQGDGAWSWIAGVFYFDQIQRGDSREFTPHFDQFFIDFALGGDGVLRPDSLEYLQYGQDDLNEKAVFGELGYQITDKWQITLGGRFYDYELLIDSGFSLPLLGTTTGELAPDAFGLELERNSQSDSGSLFKLNTSYRFTDDFLGYVTISEGFRIGASNGIAPCTAEDLADPSQAVCALPHEVQYFPDTTTNYEVGVRTQWLDRRLTFNGAAYYIDWSGPQLLSTTVNGSLPITTNGDGAESKGIELSFEAAVTDRLTVGIGYSRTTAELSKAAPDVILDFSGIDLTDGSPNDDVYVDGLAGDRLPGSPKDQGTVNVSYDLPLSGGRSISFNYGIASVGDMVTSIGQRGGGDRLGGFSVHSAAAALQSGQWTLGLYAQNLLNKYAVTGVRSVSAFNQAMSDVNGDPVTVRRYAQDVLRPREIGVKFTYSLGE
jgi:iron complex outermembrane receptor protein